MTKSYDIPGLGTVITYADVPATTKSNVPAPKPETEGMPANYEGNDPFGGAFESSIALKAKAAKVAKEEAGPIEAVDGTENYEGGSESDVEGDEEDGALEESNADDIIEEDDRVEGELEESDANDVIEANDRVAKKSLSIGDKVFVPEAQLYGVVQRLSAYIRKSSVEGESGDSVSVTVKGNGRLETFDIDDTMPLM